jgi:hypothetical protein
MVGEGRKRAGRETSPWASSKEKSSRSSHPRGAEDDDVAAGGHDAAGFYGKSELPKRAAVSEQRPRLNKGNWKSYVGVACNGRKTSHFVI